MWIVVVGLVLVGLPITGSGGAHDPIRGEGPILVVALGLPAPIPSVNATGNITTDLNLTGNVTLEGNVSVIGANLTIRNAMLTLNGSAYLEVLANGSLILANVTIIGNGTLPEIRVAGNLLVTDVSITGVAGITANGTVTIANLSLFRATLTLNASGNATGVTVQDAPLGMDVRGSTGLTIIDLTLINVSLGIALAGAGPLDISGNSTYDGLPMVIRSGLTDTILTTPLASGAVSDRGTVVLWSPSNVTLENLTINGASGLPILTLNDVTNLTLTNITLTGGEDGIHLEGSGQGQGLILDYVALENLTGTGLVLDDLLVRNIGGVSMDGVPIRLLTDVNGTLIAGEVIGSAGHTSRGDLVILRSSGVEIRDSPLSGSIALFSLDSDVTLTGATVVQGTLEVHGGNLTTSGISWLSASLDLTGNTWVDHGSILGWSNGTSMIITTATTITFNGSDLRAGLDLTGGSLDLIGIPVDPANATLTGTPITWSWMTRYQPASPGGTAVPGNVTISIAGGNATIHTDAEVLPGPRLTKNGTWDNVTISIAVSNTTHRGNLIHMPNGTSPVAVVLDSLDTVPPIINTSAYPSIEVQPLSCTSFTTADVSDDLYLAGVSYLVTLAGQEVVNGSAPFTHCWSSYGVHAVGMTAEDAAGNRADHMYTITIRDTFDPIPVIEVPDRVLPGIPFTVSGNNSGDNDRIVNWSWEFIGLQPQFRFGPYHLLNITDTGSYRIRLLVTDPAGHTGFTQISFEVADIEDPVARFSLPEIEFGDLVSLDGRASTDDGIIVSYAWSVGPDPPRTYAGPVVQVPFDRVGIANITLTITDSAGNTGVLSRVVLIEDIILPVARAGFDQELQEGEEALLDGTASSDDDVIVSWRWIFTDGTSDLNLTGSRLFHRFPVSGNWSILLLVRDASGNIGSDRLWVNVSIRQDPSARFPRNDDGTVRTNALATIGELFTIAATSSTDDEGIVNYTWTLITQGYALPSWGPVFTWVPNATEDAVLYLDVFDIENRTDRAQLVISVREAPGGGPDEEPTGPGGAELTWLVLGILGGGVIVAGIVMVVVRDIRKQRARKARARRRSRAAPEVPPSPPATGANTEEAPSAGIAEED